MYLRYRWAWSADPPCWHVVDRDSTVPLCGFATQLTRHQTVKPEEHEGYRCRDCNWDYEKARDEFYDRPLDNGQLDPP